VTDGPALAATISALQQGVAPGLRFSSLRFASEFARQWGGARAPRDLSSCFAQFSPDSLTAATRGSSNCVGIARWIAACVEPFGIRAVVVPAAMWRDGKRVGPLRYPHAGLVVPFRDLEVPHELALVCSELDRGWATATLVREGRPARMRRPTLMNGGWMWVEYRIRPKGAQKVLEVCFRAGSGKVILIEYLLREWLNPDAALTKPNVLLDAPDLLTKHDGEGRLMASVQMDHRTREVHTFALGKHLESHPVGERGLVDRLDRVAGMLGLSGQEIAEQVEWSSLLSQLRAGPPE